MLPHFPFVADRRDLLAATELVLHHGRTAQDEARARAERAREIGNHLHFCRWRQVARLVDWLTDPAPGGTLH